MSLSFALPCRGCRDWRHMARYRAGRTSLHLGMSKSVAARWGSLHCKLPGNNVGTCHATCPLKLWPSRVCKLVRSNCFKQGIGQGRKVCNFNVLICQQTKENWWGLCRWISRGHIEDIEAWRVHCSLASNICLGAASGLQRLYLLPVILQISHLSIWQRPEAKRWKETAVGELGLVWELQTSSGFWGNLRDPIWNLGLIALKLLQKAYDTSEPQKYGRVTAFWAKNPRLLFTLVALLPVYGVSPCAAWLGFFMFFLHCLVLSALSL